jgi:hypothetical protein
VGRQQLVRANGVEFFVEVADADGVGDSSGVQTVGLDHAISFDGVRETLEAVASSLAQAWEKVRPSEATVEFGLELTAKQGKLTGLLVEGGGTASLKVTLAWKDGQVAA